VAPDPVVPPEAGAFMYRRVADVNAETCPGARPVVLPLPTREAYGRLKAAVEARGLKLVTDDPAHGRLEATALSPVFRFRSDLAARVRAEGAGSRIDLRAVSRVGQSDRGMNCSLVSRLGAAIHGG
jgi:fatty-acyl-CoA synthase